MLAPIPASVHALVTGASSGLGVEFARQLAERGHDVTLVARREDRLVALAAELEQHYKISATVLVADLESHDGRERVAATLRNGEPWILVNNAGFGSRGRFVTAKPDREIAEVMLNVLAVHELTAAVLPGNVQHRSGGVINVASTAAFQPLPYMATYGATKAFVLSFTDALTVELAGTGTRMLTLCPGPVETEFGDIAGNSAELAKQGLMSAADVVRAGLRAFERNHRICVPGRSNAIGAVGVRLLPRAAVRRIVGRLFAPA